MAGASALFILDSKGRTIISRNYRGDVPMNVKERFQQNVIDQEDLHVKPIFEDDGVTYCWIQHENLYILCVTRNNPNAMMLVSFLYRVVQVLIDYFKVLGEESLRDNFVITYELLDEMMDNGLPQTTESKVLREYITNEAHEMRTVKAPPASVTNAVSWRSEGIRYKKNEIFLDVIEKLSLLVSQTGTVLWSEINGTLRMKSFLSGMPDLKLGLNDRLMADRSQSPQNKTRSVDLEDTKFHQCVRLSRFESDRTISFIPPDGEFDLMTYRLQPLVRPLIWVETSVDTSKPTRVDYVVKVKAQFKSRSVANSVEIHIPVPDDAVKPVTKTSTGFAKYDPSQQAIIWYIKQLHGQKDLIMTATFGRSSLGESQEETVGNEAFRKTPVSVKFEIPYFTVSGLTSLTLGQIYYTKW
eukprot:GHVP01061547.1.p1 GENE.GHVP01061547.1~~GHVP01061547.1.p1  ORF type:complete len:412 (-),score=54.23 GHVP01061547.1:712-1947(-)